MTRLNMIATLSVARADSDLMRLTEPPRAGMLALIWYNQLRLSRSVHVKDSLRLDTPVMPDPRVIRPTGPKRTVEMCPAQKCSSTRPSGGLIRRQLRSRGRCVVPGPPGPSGGVRRGAPTAGAPRFRSNGGRAAGRFEGVDLALLTTTGAGVVSA